MADISVNIRGRDDGLGDTIDSLREKIKGLAQEAENINDVRDIVNKNFDEKKDTVREDYRDARKANYDDYQEDKSRYESGDMDVREWSKSQRNFQDSEKELNAQETAEIRDLNIEQKNILQEILEEFRKESADETTRRQRDSGEYEKKDEGDTTINEGDENILRVFVVNYDMFPGGSASGGSGGSGGDGGSGSSGSSGSGGGRRGGVRDFGVTSAAGGDLSGAAMGAMEGVKSATGWVKGLSIAGIVAIAVKELIGQGDKLIEGVAPLGAMRGNFSSASAANNYYASTLDSDNALNNLGLNSEDFASMMVEKVKASGRSDNLRLRTLGDQAFQKGFGADISGFSEFERFTKGQDESLKIGLDVLNVLTSIKGSQLTETNLTLLSEKLGSQNALMSIQRQKRDVIDTDASLRILAAFESVGLSQKGERGANFLQNTISGLGEGGSDNMMMLKFEAAKRSRPDLSNDPAALRRLVKFNPDNPEYMNEAFKMMGELSGGDEMALDDMLYSFFPGMNEGDMGIYKKAIKSGNFQSLLKGKGMDQMKQRKGSLNESQMYADATAGVGLTTEAMSGFGNWIKEISTSFSNLKNPNGGIDVNLVSDKTKKDDKPIKTVPANTTYKKRKE